MQILTDLKGDTDDHTATEGTSVPTFHNRQLVQT